MGLFFFCQVLKSVNAAASYCLKVYYCRTNLNTMQITIQWALPGPNGHKKASTLKYWKKVKQQLQTNKPQ